jgi:UDP-N-acetylmuramate dehydrogenase
MSKITIQKNIPLAPYTSFKVGGPAEYFSLVRNSEDLLEALQCTLPETPLWIIGYGSNSLISDAGLPGMTICVQGGAISCNDTEIIADAGAWWDDVVTTAIASNLWGIELMSEIPGSVGGSTFINITAYGQSLGSRITWVEVWDRQTSSVKRVHAPELSWGYKNSVFQTEKGKNWIILRVCLSLSKKKTQELTYQKALDVANEFSLKSDSLTDRRKIIVETRRRAGSLWKAKEKDSSEARTAGSFFRNTTVPEGIAQKIIRFDESGKTEEQIKKMNEVHAGDARKVSAAHILLAAGFKRGQKFNNVKLNENNVLKIEALPGATAQDIYTTMLDIQQKVRETLNIKLEPEVRLLGDFS